MAPGGWHHRDRYPCRGGGPQLAGVAKAFDSATIGNLSSIDQRRRRLADLLFIFVQKNE
jgi:hypothetical protein